MDNEQIILEQMTEKQQRIVEAAIEIFAEKGYSGTSTSEIAKKAGVAEGTIFRHYKTKKDLLFGIVGPMITKFIAPMAARDFNKVLDVKYHSFEDFLRAALINRVELVERKPAIIKIVLQEVPFHPELKNQLIESIGRKIYERISIVIKEFQSKGEIVQLPVSTVFRLILTSIFGYIVSAYIILPGSIQNKEEEIEQTIQFVLKGLRP
ncbi:MAG: TetR family transcriptional regulator [Bacillales bacterium]|jgi:AcrR family transcriptional regulator|nr:TetR family transcriptional regulator [Bacillales bacterium]